MEKPFCSVCFNVLESLAVNLSEPHNLEDGLTYGDCIRICTSVKLDNKYQICQSCLLELKTSYKFHKRVKRAQGLLREIEKKKSISDDVEADFEEDTTTKEGISRESNDSFLILEENTIDEDSETYESLEEFEVVEEESSCGLKEIDFASDASDNFQEQLEENSGCFEQESEMVENSTTIPFDEISFQQIEIIPKQCGTSDPIKDLKTIKLKTKTEKSRKRIIGKFNCDFCDKLFPNHSRMIAHRRSHEPDRPKFSCNECGRIYSTNQALDVHIQAVHKMSGYECKICSKIFPAHANLIVHMRYHTGHFPYVCEICGQKFGQLSHLKTHRNVKHFLHRFCCSHTNCGKFFTSSTSLRNHEYTHGLMPFECEFCNREYPCKSKLKVHVQRAHKKALTLAELEPMRRFHVIRSKPHIVKVDEGALEKNSSGD